MVNHSLAACSMGLLLFNYVAHIKKKSALFYLTDNVDYRRDTGDGESAPIIRKVTFGSNLRV